MPFTLPAGSTDDRVNIGGRWHLLALLFCDFTWGQRDSERINCTKDEDDFGLWLTRFNLDDAL